MVKNLDKTPNKNHLLRTQVPLIKSLFTYHKWLEKTSKLMKAVTFLNSLKKMKWEQNVTF